VRNVSSRTRALLVLVNGSPLAEEPEIHAIRKEIKDISDAGLAGHRRRTLLQAFHTARTLDTSLVVFIRSKGLGPKPRSLRESLQRLGTRQRRDVAALNPGHRDAYVNQIVHPRNDLMHNAGATLSQDEANKLLVRMEACLVEVLRL